MLTLRTSLLISFISVLWGCAYNAPVDIAPANNVYNNYEQKLPGRYALYVDGANMNGEGRQRGLACSAHKYPYEGENPFAQSVLATFKNIVEDIEMVSEPLEGKSLREQNFNAQLSVEVESSEVKLTVHQGFWSSEIEADVEIVASVRAMNESGVLLGSTVEGRDDEQAPAGMACGGAATAMQMAMSSAIEKVMGRLGERLANARKLRAASLDWNQSDTE